MCLISGVANKALSNTTILNLQANTYKYLLIDFKLYSKSNLFLQLIPMTFQTMQFLKQSLWIAGYLFAYNIIDILLFE